MLAFAERMNEPTETYEIKYQFVMATFKKLWFTDYSSSINATDVTCESGRHRHKRQKVETNVHTKKYLEAETMYSNRIAHDIVNFIAHLTGGFDWVIEMVQKALWHW